MKTLHNRQLIVRLQAEIHKVLAPLIPTFGNLALLDFPYHDNVGDSAIWLGEIAYFHRVYKILPAYVCTCPRYAQRDNRKQASIREQMRKKKRKTW